MSYDQKPKRARIFGSSDTASGRIARPEPIPAAKKAAQRHTAPVRPRAGAAMVMLFLASAAVGGALQAFLIQP